MTTKKRINLRLHPIELATLDRIADEYKETRSGMITRLIQEFPEKEHRDTRNLGELTELTYALAKSPRKSSTKKRDKAPKEYEDKDQIGDISNRKM